MKDRILSAARADGIPIGASGLWHVKKYRLAKPILAPGPHGKLREIPPGSYTNLFRYTEATMHQLGDLVMQDTPDELSKHLIFMLRASGRVLITGLGLGCVVRGCLANPNVKDVTVVENSRDVIKLVWEHMPWDRRCNLVFADALEYVKTVRDDEFDCAWTDLWVDESPNEEGKSACLQKLHMEVLCDLAGKVDMQGVWEFPRYFRRTMRFAKVI